MTDTEKLAASIIDEVIESIEARCDHHDLKTEITAMIQAHVQKLEARVKMYEKKVRMLRQTIGRMQDEADLSQKHGISRKRGDTG